MQVSKIAANLIKLRKTPLPVKRDRSRLLDDAILLLEQLADEVRLPVDTLTLPLFPK